MLREGPGAGHDLHLDADPERRRGPDVLDGGLDIEDERDRRAGLVRCDRHLLKVDPRPVLGGEVPRRYAVRVQLREEYQGRDRRVSGQDGYGKPLTVGLLAISSAIFFTFGWVLSESRLKESDDCPRLRLLDAVVVVLWTIGHVLGFFAIGGILEWDELVYALKLLAGAGG